MDAPASPDWLIRRARAPAALLRCSGTAVGGLELGPAADGLVAVDLAITSGRIGQIAPAGTLAVAGATDVVDADDGIVFPCFVDMHTHLDKGHISARTANPDGSFASAIVATAADRERHWRAQDVAQRMDFALRCAYAHGTSLLRTHIDSMPPQDAVSWPVFAQMREAWAGRIELQAASLMLVSDLPADRDLDSVARTIAGYGGVLGAVLFMTDGLDSTIERMIETAGRHDLALDFHVDENGDPASRCLDRVAHAVLRTGFDGAKVVCGHCCALMRQPEQQAAATLDAVARAGIGIVSLPMCNLYLQDRTAGRTPTWRPGTLVHEMAARGIPVAFASDNTRDPFYAYGDLDMVEVLREAVRIMHLDHPIDAWPAAVAATPAAMIGRPDRGRLCVGDSADLIVFRARNWGEFLARPQLDRQVFRRGERCAAPLPDYRELDTLCATRP